MSETKTMGPAKGTKAYEEQVAEVRGILALAGAKTDEDEDAVILLFAVDERYSREAIMDGIGRYRTERRNATPDA